MSGPTAGAQRLRGVQLVIVVTMVLATERFAAACPVCAAGGPSRPSDLWIGLMLVAPLVVAVAVAIAITRAVGRSDS